MKAAVLLNPRAGALFARGAAHDVDGVRGAFAAAGVEATVELIEGEDLGPPISRAARRHADVLVVGGGDGSVSSAAAVLAGGDVPLGILPFGTLNHFARDVGLPLDLAAAVRVIADGHVRGVDVGEVNGLVFVNNSALGGYPHLVEERETHQRHHHMAKWRAGVHAFAAVLRRPPVLTVTLGGPDDQSSTLTTSFVLIGNNRYVTGLRGFARRTALDQGRLSVYVAYGGRRYDAVRSLSLLMLDRPEAGHIFQAAELPELSVAVDAPSVKVSIDGEVRHLAPPLVYRVRPRDLRVVVPAVAP